MKKSKFGEKQVIAILKEYESGRKVSDICRAYSISQPTFYQWRSKYLGMGVEQLKRVREMEAELAHYRKLVAEQVRDILMLKDLIIQRKLEPDEKRRAIAYYTQEHSVSVRRACKLLGTHPSLVMYKPRLKDYVSTHPTD
jgi:putative transposase